MVAVGLLLLGIVALFAGAELVVRSGSRLAARLGISPIVIGVTVVSVGTSAPELAIGIEAALRDNGSLAVGNIAGTNTVNLLLILGLSALIRPLALQMQTLRFDLPVMASAALAFLWMARDGVLTLLEGGILVAGALAYTAAVIYFARRESETIQTRYIQRYASRRDGKPFMETAGTLALLLIGIAVIVLGSGWLVDGAVDIARTLGVSDAFIGLTVVAIGTSSPELVTTIVGTLRKQRDIAIGNLLGSSTYNILLILGVTCMVPASGLEVETDLVRIDIPVMAAVTLACIPIFLTRRRITRLEGALFVGAYAVYLGYLIVART